MAAEFTGGSAGHTVSRRVVAPRLVGRRQPLKLLLLFVEHVGQHG
jgi:hypothetical protein